MTLKRVIYIVLFFSVLFFLIRTGSLIYFEYKADKMVEELTSSAQWTDKYHSFYNEKKMNKTVIFLGDSHFEYFDLSCFIDTNLLNRGIAGDVTDALLQRLPEIYRFKPEKVFIEIGINDLLMKISPQRIESNYRKIIKDISKNCPDVKIYMLSIFPLQNKSINKKIIKLNSAIEQICRENNCTYIDVYSVLSEENQINSFSTDGIHLNKKGYQVLAKTLSVYLY